MPLYEYACKGCDRRFEVVQKFSDAELRECSECGGELEKLISSSAFQLKGSGWYVTDYARKGSKDGGASSESKGTDSSESSATMVSKDSKDSRDSKESRGSKESSSLKESSSSKESSSKESSSKESSPKESSSKDSGRKSS